MSNLVELYNTSKNRIVEEARQIPGRIVNFFDRQSKFASGFTTGRSRQSPSEFTPSGLDHFNTEREELTPPESFDPSRPLHRYTPETPFHEPGAGDTSTS